SVITTKRAYEELKRDGFITSFTGKGSCVAEQNLEFIREEQLRKIENHIQEILDLSRGIGLSLDDLIQMLSIIYEEESQ
ncbi:GntR family transcriptional regulator, partial [Eubacterium aggregans]|uniref:GntR family transcriptional regulator n=1 Tax=Eubacterium aggregans TaxID=81409 RepID=UPI003F38FB89